MIVLVQGPPCTGKSTLCKQLSEVFSARHLSKDHVSEAMFAAGVTGPTGRAANALLMRSISQKEEGEVLLVETNFSKERDMESLKDAIGNRPVVEIFLHGPKELLIERFVKRWESGARHPSHEDDQKISDLELYLDGDPKPIGIGEVLSVDSSEAQSAVLMRARDFLSGRLASDVE